MLSRIGRSSRLARSSASSPHAYQSTGLCACCKRYGLVSLMRRFGIEGSSQCISRDRPVRCVPFRFSVLEKNRLRRFMPDAEHGSNGVGYGARFDHQHQSARDIAGSFEELGELFVHLVASSALRAMLENNNGMGFRTLQKSLEI